MEPGGMVFILKQVPDSLISHLQREKDYYSLQLYTAIHRYKYKYEFVFLKIRCLKEIGL